jgi:N6-adenosine-specific RNA methylase IME4
MENGLTQFERAKQALALCTTVDEVKDIRDKAEALRAYQKQVGATLEMQNQCAEIKIRAERRAGELLKDLTVRGRPEKGSSVEPLSSLGIGKTQSHRWQTIAAPPEKQFDQYIQQRKAAGHELTSAGAYRFAKQAMASATDDAQPVHEDVGTLGEFIESGIKFGTVYADPPWRYGNQGTRAATDNHYPTMTVDEICDMPVVDVVADNAHLHLWTTNAFLFEAQRVMEAWGFTYKSVMVWVKPQMGIGNYWRVSHEFLLFGVRGSCPFRDRSQMSWLEAKRTAHSRKPEVFADRVELVSPGPYLEMFGRRTRPGWSIMGNQVLRSMYDADTVSAI